MNQQRPLLIVVSIVRNEAWVLDAFLSATSLWADMIIIADQMSTDGSRDIYKRYPKVHMIDNDRPNMHQAASRRLVLDEARRILNGNNNAVLFALDADEILEGDFMQSVAWGQIVNSKPNDCFEWRWMNLLPGDATHYDVPVPYYWAVHVSEQLWDGIFPDSKIHEWRLPWPNTDVREIKLNDLYSIHFGGGYHVNRQRNKSRFYQVNSMEDSIRYNVINLFRQYHEISKCEIYQVPKDAYVYYERIGLDILSMINLLDDGEHFTKEVKAYFEKNGTAKYAMLDIWDEDWCKRNNIETPKRNVVQKIIMWYLRISNPYSRSIIVRAIDKFLKMIYK
jgi:hypothetical protein